MFKYLLVLALALLAVSNVNAATNNVKCSVCGYLVNYVEGLIELEFNNSTAIVNELEKVCVFVPAALQPTCDSVIELYSKEIAEMVLAKENSTVVCEQVGLCPKPSATPVSIKKEGDAKCTICDFVVGEVEKYVEGNATEAQIINFLNKDCKIFGSFEATCQALVQQYVPTIISLLENKQSPSTVCAEIKLCTSAFRKPTPAAEKVTGAVSCAICEAVAGEVEKLVSTNSTESQIENAVEQVCNTLPGSFLQQTCDGLVESYLPQIINYCEQKESPTVVCTQISLCGNNNGSSSESPSSSDNSGSQSGSTSGAQTGAATGSMSGSSGSMSGTSGSGSGSGSSMRITIQ